ncbi:MAG: Nif3-like dinuclear metal center hexameric protein, partial [Gemmatimonadota bacterium]
LRTSEISDYAEAVNGLQVENSGSVTRLAVAVDACQAVIDRAVDIGADLLLVHHGLFWRGLEPLSGRHGRRIRKLVRSDIAVYSSHLPLDVHPEVGNNVVLARMLGLEPTEPFAEAHGQHIGLSGYLSLSLHDFTALVTSCLGVEPMVIAGGPQRVTRVGVVAGAGGSFIEQARDIGLDTYLTGEGSHHTYFDAEEWGLNLIYAGHYATETVGVKALAGHIEEVFGLPWDFIEHPTGM